MSKSKTVFITGTLYWFKGVNRGQAVQNYDGDGYEWTFEVEPDDIEFLKEHRLLDRLKDPLAYAVKLEKKYKQYGDEEDKRKAEKAREAAEGRGDYLILRKPTTDKDGNETDPFRIYDENNEPWDRDTMIGNGSKADLKLSIIDWGPGKKQSIYCKAIRITDHVPYESDEFAAMDAQEETAKTAPKKTRAKPKKAEPKASSAENFEDLDDDIPF
jgi:hypothetical protein